MDRVYCCLQTGAAPEHRGLSCPLPLKGPHLHSFKSPHLCITCLQTELGLRYAVHFGHVADLYQRFAPRDISKACCRVHDGSARGLSEVRVNTS